VFDITLINSFQCRTQFVVTDDITWQDQRKNVQITDIMRDMVFYVPATKWPGHYMLFSYQTGYIM
jgi:hypothetical protein